MANVETRKRQKRKANGSMVFRPIFMTGKDVPQRHPASRVNNIALALWLSTYAPSISQCSFDTTGTQIKEFS